MGAVNLYSLYSRHPAAFDEHSCAVGTVLAAHAAIAMSAAREHERADQVEDALRSSREIGMAVGGAGSWRGDPGRGVRDAAPARRSTCTGQLPGQPLQPRRDWLIIETNRFCLSEQCTPAGPRKG
jgi:hypothetical protein